VSALSAVHCPLLNSFRRVAYFANQKQLTTYPAVMQFERLTLIWPGCNWRLLKLFRNKDRQCIQIFAFVLQEYNGFFFHKIFPRYNCLLIGTDSEAFQFYKG